MEHFLYVKIWYLNFLKFFSSRFWFSVMLSSSYGCDEFLLLTQERKRGGVVFVIYHTYCFLLYDHACSHMQSIILIFKFHLISDANIGQEHQHINHVPSFTPKMGKHLDPNSQMELVGHSIVRPSHLSLFLSISNIRLTYSDV